MKNIELIKNKNGGYGLREIDTKRVIIPAMYERCDLELITEVIELAEFTSYSKDIYLLKGISVEGIAIFGLYNSFNNDFLKLEYNNVILGEKLKLQKGSEELIYDESVSRDNTAVVKKVASFTDNNVTYGLKTANGAIIIPTDYSKLEMWNIGDALEVLDGVYILKSRIDSNKIVGFYDAKRHYLEQGEFNDYGFRLGCLVLYKNVNNNDTQGLSSYFKRTSIISIYDPIHGKYLTGDFFNNIYIKHDGSILPYFGLKEVEDILILNDRVLYDTKSGNYIESEYNFFISDTNDRMLELRNKYGAFRGYFDLYTRELKKFNPIHCKELLSFEGFGPYFYVSQDSKEINYAKKYYPVEEYSDFYKITGPQLTILFDKDYNLLSCNKKRINILEIKPETVESLGIPASNGKSVYLIRKNLYTFGRNNSKNQTIFNNFQRIKERAITALEYEYGICEIEATSIAELDIELDNLETREHGLSSLVENRFYQDEELMAKYPELVRTKK